MIASPTGRWIQVSPREHRIAFDCGMQLELYQSGDGCWCWRLTGCQHQRVNDTRSRDVTFARKQALRGLGLLLDQAANQTTAALIDCGTGMTT